MLKLCLLLTLRDKQFIPLVPLWKMSIIMINLTFKIKLGIEQLKDNHWKIHILKIDFFQNSEYN